MRLPHCQETFATGLKKCETCNVPYFIQTVVSSLRPYKSCLPAHEMNLFSHSFKTTRDLDFIDITHVKASVLFIGAARSRQYFFAI